MRVTGEGTESHSGGLGSAPGGREGDQALGPASVCSHDPAGREARGHRGWVQWVALRGSCSEAVSERDAQGRWGGRSLCLHLIMPVENLFAESLRLFSAAIGITNTSSLESVAGNHSK